ncbi:MAG TPA: ribonuclease E activity regulator RraA [Propionibacteriaceae bacterium]|nr:ribonuclease E activity regulator RraA [Propionibacteriaceae bacterium]
MSESGLNGAAQATADLVDQYGTELASIPLQFRSYGGRPRFCGVVVTLKCFEDNALLKQTLADEESPRGKVLVIDGGGSYRSALVGDVIAGIAVRREWAGLIIHGVVRDSVALSGLDLGIKALGTNPAKSGKTGAGQINIPIDIGGVRFLPGSTVYCDEDGIVVRASDSAR